MKRTVLLATVLLLSMGLLNGSTAAEKVPLDRPPAAAEPVNLLEPAFMATGKQNPFQGLWESPSFACEPAFCLSDDDCDCNRRCSSQGICRW